LFQGLKLPIKWFAIFLCLVLLSGVIWGYERLSGNFYLSRLERKITLLADLQKIANSGMDIHPELIDIYNSSVKELDSFEVSQSFIPSLKPINLGNTTIWKSLSGASIWIIVLVAGVASEIKKVGKVTGMVIFLGVVLALIALLFAWFGAIIPTILNPWVNYIGFPLIQFGILYFATRKTSKQVS
jgi:hypothetical protein